MECEPEYIGCRLQRVSSKFRGRDIHKDQFVPESIDELQRQHCSVRSNLLLCDHGRGLEWSGKFLFESSSGASADAVTCPGAARAPTWYGRRLHRNMLARNLPTP